MPDQTGAVMKFLQAVVAGERELDPLHYAADTNHWAPAAQKATIELRIAVGADPNALDDLGVSPLPRAVRPRSSAGVQALLAGGADVRLTNTRGSTPLHLALRTTGRTGSGAARAKLEQRKIIQLLLDAGADPSGALSTR